MNIIFKKNITHTNKLSWFINYNEGVFSDDLSVIISPTQRIYSPPYIDVPGKIWISKNGGENFYARLSINENFNVWTISLGGDYILVKYGSRIQMSTDKGDTFSEIQPAGDVDKSWSCFGVSNNGTKIIAGVSGGRLYLSTDSGSTWSEIRPNGDVDKSWSCVKISGDGNTIVAGVSGGRLYLSTDSGSTWSEIRPNGDVDDNWWSIDMSFDGSTIVVSTRLNPGTSYFYLSTDGGSTWVKKYSIRYDSVVSVTSNGQYICADKYYSIDGGETFVELYFKNSVYKRFSNDGKKIITTTFDSNPWSLRQLVDSAGGFMSFF